MSGKIDEILERMKALENELRSALQKREEELSYHIQKHKVYFDPEVLARHKKEVIGLYRYIKGTPILNILTAPVIYGLVFPALLIDLSVTLYQAVCFPVYKIKKVKRSDHIIIDRHYLSYLNLIEKINCIYCGYMNGMFGYITEVAARTEQYWCPIKHARKTAFMHSRYRHFTDYGEAETYHEELKRLRAMLKELDDADPERKKEDKKPL